MFLGIGENNVLDCAQVRHRAILGIEYVEEAEVRKALLTLFAGAILAGPLASVAAAGPVDEAAALARRVACQVQEKLGFENVQECTLS